MGNTGTMKRMGRAGRVNVTRKDGSNRECNQLIAAALTSGCAQENKKLRQNVLDGADFVRDVLDSYPKRGLAQILRGLLASGPWYVQKLDRSHRARVSAGV